MAVVPRSALQNLLQRTLRAFTPYCHLHPFLSLLFLSCILPCSARRTPDSRPDPGRWKVDTTGVQTGYVPCGCLHRRVRGYAAAVVEELVSIETNSQLPANEAVAPANCLRSRTRCGTNWYRLWAAAHDMPHLRRWWGLCGAIQTSSSCTVAPYVPCFLPLL